MPEIDIRNLLISFPYEPYEIQKEYMSKVVDCLQNKHNGVLESPTGTGKTLSLLCSSLAWLCAQTAAFQMRETQNSHDETNNFLMNLQAKLDSQIGGSASSWGGNSIRPPRVIYASRTHSQLNQAMLELRKTSYNHVRVGLLGSRDQLCIHPQVSKEPDATAKIHMCKMLLAEKKCRYHLDVEKKVNETVFLDEKLMDVEDLLRKGKQAQCCPYFASREFQKTAQVIFTPYNYLLDPKTRKAQDISLFNDVVILDEAHNIERVCEESASTFLNSTTVAICITEITAVMKIFSDEMEENSPLIDKGAGKDFNMDELALLKTAFLMLEKAIDDVELPNKSKTFPGSHIFRILNKAEINTNNRKIFIEKLDCVCQFLMTINESLMHQKGAALAKFSDFLGTVFNSLGPNFSEDYTDLNFKLHVEMENIKTPKGNSWGNTTTHSGGKVLNFWCFNPAFGMKSLIDLGVHNVILTSGTLSPLSATISEIGIPVNVQLSNQHIIKANQICAVVVDKGPAGTELRCVYQNRTNEKYLADLGQTCLNFYRVIPGGVLVFFPSYPFLKSCVDFWRTNGTWDKMAAIKSIFIEPKSKEEMKSMMEDYYNMLNERGASLFAVCRGKISEGLDFSDDRARAVIVVGLPYPPFNDPRVALKREYLDNGKKTKKSLLDGNEWYQLEAVRAVNQAVGRVIRHAGDHGAIIFCDCRFSFPNNIKTLSSWLQSHIVPNASFGQGLKLISQFFKSWKDTPTKIYYDDNSKPFASSHTKTLPQTSPKVGGPLPCSSRVTDYTKIYCQSDDQKLNKYDIMKTERAASGAKRKSVLDSLEEKESEDNSHNSVANSNSEFKRQLHPESDCNTTTTVSKSPIDKVLKKRRIVITNRKQYDTEKIENAQEATSKSSNPNRDFILKFQKNANSEQMLGFKSAIREYSKDNGCVRKFIQQIAAIMLWSDNPVLSALFKDIEHYLKNDEHKAHFREFHSKNT